MVLEAELATFIAPATPSPTLHLLSSRAFPEAPYDLICFDFNLLDTPFDFEPSVSPSSISAVAKPPFSSNDHTRPSRCLTKYKSSSTSPPSSLATASSS